MFGNKVYELSLVKDYVSHWGLAEAARELIQNALDSDSPFEYEFVRDTDDVHDSSFTFKLRSENARLEPRHLLLGATSKAHDAAAIGSFGEGFKIALLVLTRLGYPVAVLNGGVEWRPAFRYNRRFEQELLVIEEAPAERKTQGLTFLVGGLSAEDARTVRAGCLKMQPEVGEVLETSKGQILLDRPGELYVGSLLVTRNDMHFGYNVRPEHLRLERDRQTVDDWDMRCLTRDMWYETGQHERVAQMIFDDVPDLYYARYGAPQLVQEACYARFRELHPGALIAESPAEMKKMIDAGLVKTVYVGGSAGAIVKGHAAYQAEVANQTRTQTPSEFLLSWVNAETKNMAPLGVKHFHEQVLAAAKTWRNA